MIKKIGLLLLFLLLLSSISYAQQDWQGDSFTWNGKTFANLGGEVDGKSKYCKDCTSATPCAGGGTGAWAVGVNGQWSCAMTPTLTVNNPGSWVKNVKTDYNASGSNQTATGCTVNATTSLVCTSAADFATNQGILLAQAGPAALNTLAPAAPTVTDVGTAGTTTYTYKTAIIDYWMGISPASPAASITTGPATANGVNYPKIVISGITCTNCGVIIYRTAGGNGQGPIAISVYGNGNVDDSNLPVISNPLIPATPPTTALNQEWVGTVSSVSGNTITLSTAPPSSLSGTWSAYHDDTQAIQSAVTNNTNKEIIFPAGTYNINQPSWYNQTTAAWVYVNPTTSPAANMMFGIIHLVGNEWLSGVGRESTTIQSYLFASLYQALFAEANPTVFTVPGATCNSAADTNTNVTTKYNIVKNGRRGASYIQTVTASNASNFNFGDLVKYGGGVNDAEVSCASTTPAADLNRVLSADSTTGFIRLQYPLTRDYPYGAEGTVSFIEKINNLAIYNVVISDMTLSTLGGGQALGYGDIVKGRVQRVNVLQPTWNGAINLAESRDIIFDDVHWLNTSSDEFDQSKDIVIQNSILNSKSGYKQWAFSQGAGNILIKNNTFTGDDSMCGLNARCDSGGPQVIALTIGGANYIIDNNKISISSDNYNDAIVTTATNANIPVPENYIITNNIIRPNSLNGRTNGITLNSNAMKGVLISNNDIFLTPSAANAWAISTDNGNILNNHIQEINQSDATLGLININQPNIGPPTLTEPLQIIGNNLVGQSQSGNDYCIEIQNPIAGRPLITNNYCTSFNTGIFVNAVSSNPILANNGMYLVTTPCAPSSVCGTTLLSNRATEVAAGIAPTDAVNVSQLPISGVITMAPTTIPANQCFTQSIPLPNVTANMTCIASPNTVPTFGIQWSEVTTPNGCMVQECNITNNIISPPPLIFNIRVVQ